MAIFKEVFGLDTTTGMYVSRRVEADPADLLPPTPEELRQNMPALNPAQIRLGLSSIGITDAMVEEALADDPDGLTEWRFRPTYRRTHPLVDGLAARFELPADQVDALWTWAAAL